jgi:hypothetical protein
MARRANGLDLSDAFIIVDYYTIKNTSSLPMFYFVSGNCSSNTNRGIDSTC